jgi:hypothetical protein
MSLKSLNLISIAKIENFDLIIAIIQAVLNQSLAIDLIKLAASLQLELTFQRMLT